jgi:hypothetical protein
MQMLNLPFVNLPAEFTKLLRTPLSSGSSSETIFEAIGSNKAIYAILDKAFKEFNDGRGLEKTMIALGWSNFRDRMASIYVYKSVYGDFPTKTSMELVDDVKQLENQYSNHGVHSLSRVFLLGFYLKLANIQIQRRTSNKFMEIKIPDELNAYLKMSHGRSDKIDWLILIVLHLHIGLGEKLLMNSLVAGKKFDELYNLMSPELRKNMLNNLLAYGASIREKDVFFYDKI